MSGHPLGGTAGLDDARAAFSAAMEAETPSRSKNQPDREKPNRMGMDDLFPRREMDRSEPEGGADDEPEIVKRRRAELRQTKDREGNQNFGEIDDDAPPRDPTEGNDEDEDADDLDEGREPEPDEEEEEQEEASPGDLDLDQIVEVNVDGQPLQVSLQEALRGYIRQETFHRRLGELSQGVQALQTQRNEMQTYQQAFVERANALEAYVQAFMPKEPNWEEIYAQDPVNGMRMERNWRSFLEQVAGLKQAREATQQELTAAEQVNLANFASANRAKLAQAHPEWQKEAVWKRDHESMRRTARSVGYSDHEIDQLYDARGVEILLKAANWDRMIASKPKPVRNGYGQFPAKRNGATPSRNVSRSFDRAEKRLSRTGSIEAAARVFEGILDRER
jgi:hypothetical protein